MTKVPNATSGPFVVWNLPRRVDMSRAQLGSNPEKPSRGPSRRNRTLAMDDLRQRHDYFAYHLGDPVDFVRAIGIRNDDISDLNPDL